MKTRIIQNEPTRPAADRRPGWVARHRLRTFFVLAFVLAWTGWALHPFGIRPQEGFQAAGALVAALIVIAFADGKAGFADLGRRIIRWRVPWYYYAFAIGLPIVVRFVCSAVNSAPDPRWTNLAWTSFLLAFLLRLVNPLDGPVAEEPAWRGFAVPWMQAARSPLGSAVVLGVLVALWHLPLLGDTGWIGIATTFVITIVYVWLFNRTGGSVLLVVLFHSAQGFITMPDLGYAGGDLSRQEWLEFAAWTLVALVLLVADRRAWRTAPADATPLAAVR
jgi:membrane protease YdiL (CAAX protease family)